MTALSLMLSVALLVGILVQTSVAGGALTAEMSGDQQVGDGDPNGTGTAVIKLRLERKKVCFDLRWSKIGAPFAAHIHAGGAGVDGGVAVGLFQQADPLPSTIQGVSGCAKDVARSVIRDIRDNPGEYYVNVHNGAYSAGAIRGQLG